MRFTSLFLLALTCSPVFGQTPLKLRVDASDAPRRLFHVQMSMPAKTGPMTLLYPQWIPGEHGPTGPVTNLVGLKVTGGGRNLPWKRDSVNMFAFHVEVPAGVSNLDVTFDFISPPEAGGFTSGSSTTTELAVLNWNQLLLYPEGSQADNLQIQATLKVPNTWRYGTALPIARETGNEIEFKPAALTTMVDSPVSTGAHYRTIDLGTENGAPHYLHLAADSDRALEVSPEVVAQYKNLVKESGALFGARHYRAYHFLFTLSDHVAHFGLEHHESSDDRLEERNLIDPESLRVGADLLPHEFVHSWNGKYRRPAGLTDKGRDGGFETPMKGDLLWVYEGLTEYLGEVLAGRSGLWSPEDYRDRLAETAAMLDNRSGRQWRPLEDTAVAAQILYEAGSDYADYRRSVDYYPEGTLIWLDVDTTLRQLSKGKKSIDDFCLAFHGGASGSPDLKTYEMADVVATLNSVQPHDWAAFLNERIHSLESHAPLNGIKNGGWKLIYDGERSDLWKAEEDADKLVDLSYSIGIKVREDATISDIHMGGAADKAGISPSTKIIAVNGRQYNSTILREAVAKTATDTKPIELLIKNGEYYQTFKVEYRGGRTLSAPGPRRQRPPTS